MTNQPWGQPPQQQGFGAPAGPGFAPGATGQQAPGQWPAYPPTVPGGARQQTPYAPPGLPPAPPSRPPSGGARVAMIIAIVLAIIVAGVLVGVLVVSLRPRPVPSPIPTSADPTTSPTAGPSSSAPTSASPTQSSTTGGGAKRTPGTPGNFRDLRVPASFDTFTAESAPMGEYGSGRWIGTPNGGTSIGWWYTGTIGSTRGSIVGSIVQNASISELNSYSFTNVTQVNGATCGSWLSNYEACFIAVDNGFVGVQVDRHDFGAGVSADQVARLLAAYRAALT